MTPVILISALMTTSLKVAATTGDLAAIAEAIGGERVEVTAMAAASQDPHFVDARPNLALELARADLLLVIGLGMEIGWLPTLQVGSRNGKIQRGSPGYLDCSQFVALLEAPREKIDRSMGDIHPGGNPHYLYDPRAGLEVAKGIAKRMSELDPQGAKIYEKNLAALAGEIEEFQRKSEARLAALRGVKVIGYHKTLPYLAAWTGLEVIEHLEPKPGIPPNPQHVAKVIAAGKAQGARAVLVESYYPATTAQLAAEKVGAMMIRISPAANFARGETYLQQMERLLAALDPIAQKGAKG